MMTLTQEQAQELVDAFEVDSTLDSKEERELLFENNPRQLAALIALKKIADGADR